MKRGKTCLAAFLALISGGCALTGNYVLPGDARAPHRVILLQMPMLVEHQSMSKLFAPKGAAAESVDSDKSLTDAVDHAQRLAFSVMLNDLQNLAGIEVEITDAALRAAHELGLDSENVTPSELVQGLRDITGADAVLRFRITDYGVTPKSWRKGVIIFEVVSTLGIAGIAYAYPRTRPIAGLYLVEESIEETAWYYGGFWALDEVCRPVRIEAELIPLNAGTVPWKSSSTGLSDIGLTRLVRDVGKAERDAQLNSALEAAATKIVSDLAETFSRGAIHTRANGEHGTHAVGF